MAIFRQYMKSSFTKRLKRHSIKWACNANVQRLSFGKEFFTYVYTRIYVHVYEELFSKTWSPNIALALQHQFLDWRFTNFGKELFTSLTHSTPIVWLGLLFYVLATSKIISEPELNLWQCPIMATLLWSHIGTPDHQHHELISYSVTLSQHWANQSMPYPNFFFLIAG